MRAALAVLVLAVVLAACGRDDDAAAELGPDFEAGRAVFSRSCAACHGGGGRGGAAPALTDVARTFTTCDDQIVWVTLGSERYESEVGPTFPGSGEEITAVMPSFEAVLTAEEIARVVAFERHVFAGAEATATLAECGLGAGEG